MRAPARSRRGITLIEVVIATLVSLILTAAAVAFATQETRLLDLSQERLEANMVGRSALALLADDLRKAGAGVGYDEQGRFLGLVADNFTAGGLAFNGTGSAIAEGDNSVAPVGVSAQNTFTRPRAGTFSGQTYTVPTHDLGIRFANGSYATIIRERGYSGTLCSSPDISYENNEWVVLRDSSGISALSGTIQVGAPTTGAGCRCVGGCSAFTFTPTPTMMMSGQGANRVTYGYGEVQGGLQTVVWFVVANATGEGELRRVTFDDPNDNCAARQTCGGLVADFAEAMYTQIWRWNSVTNQWTQAGQGANPATEERMRVDVELILRSENETRSLRPEVQAKLRANACVPAPCGSPDKYTRLAYRTSVEIMNSGVMRMR
ncbi:MAG: prepilin-type N-terminal cleavage/methylation domain-containing protein [Myxococcota bacterium]